MANNTRFDLADFHTWAYSNLFSNINRSIFGEYLVARALGVEKTSRIEWDSVDLHYIDKGIEVKTTGYIQSWESKLNKNPKFDIKKTFGWDSVTNVYEKERRRSADVYVFCVSTLEEVDQERILDMVNWEFYVVSTEYLDKELGDQKCVSLNRLKRVMESVRYEELREVVDRLIG